MAVPLLTEKQIKEDPEQQLRNFKGKKDFLVAIDTDGCVTDNMNGKQMLIFHPQFMEFYNLWDIESYFREVAEYYNLFSVHRGCNRFVAIQLTVRALAQREDVRKVLTEKHVRLPDTKPLDDYISFTQQKSLGLGNPSLEKFIDQNPTCLPLYKLLGWSEAVNRTFPHISAKIPPFKGVKECLDLMAPHADIIVVSKTPYKDLAEYWRAHGMDDHIDVIAGQEMGSKSHHIEVAKKAGNYEDGHVLMIGDGKGDLKAVKENNGLFYPVSAGREQQSWDEFPDAFEVFIQEKYQGEFEQKLLTFFDNVLLDTPLWEEPGYDHTQSYRQKQGIRKALYEKLNPEGRLLVL